MSTHRRGKKVARAFSAVELLEPRRLCSASVVGQTLVVRAEVPGVGNSEVAVEVNVDHSITVTINGNAETFNKQIRRIRVVGTAGDDSITVTDSVDLIRTTILGLGGNDVITTGDGDDLIYGGAGDDTIASNGGKDRVFGGAGNDIIDGGDGDDRIFGNAGDDQIATGSGKNFADPGGGADHVSSTGIGDRIVRRATTIIDPTSPSFEALKQNFIEEAVAHYKMRFGKQYVASDFLNQAESIIFPSDPLAGFATAASSAAVPADLEVGSTPTVNSGGYKSLSGDLVGFAHWTGVGGNFVLTIVSVADHANPVVVSQIPFTTSGFVNFVIDGDRLALVTVAPNESVYISSPQPNAAYYAEFLAPKRPYIDDYQISSIVHQPRYALTVYDLSDPTTPTIDEQTTFHGVINQLNVIGGHLYFQLRNTYYLPPPRALGPNGETVPSDGNFVIPANEYFYESESAYRQYLDGVYDNLFPSFSVDQAASNNAPVAGLFETLTIPGAINSNTITSIVDIDLHDSIPGPAAAASVLANFSEFNVTPDAWFAFAGRDWSEYRPYNQNNSAGIFKFDLAPGSVTLAAMGAVPARLARGIASGQFMDYSNGTLRLITHLAHDNQQNYMQVFVLEQVGQTFKIVGQTPKFGSGMVFSMNFVGDMAVLSTSTPTGVSNIWTDRLLIVDTSDPTHPRLVNSKVTDHRISYIAPIDDVHFVQAGATGVSDVEFGVYDISDPVHPLLIDQVFPNSTDIEIAHGGAYNTVFDPALGLLVSPMRIGSADVVLVQHVDMHGVTTIGQINLKTDQVFVTPDYIYALNSFTLNPGRIWIAPTSDPTNVIGSIAVPF